MGVQEGDEILIFGPGVPEFIYIMLAAILIVSMIISFVPRKGGELEIITPLYSENGFCFKGWEMTEALQAEVDAGLDLTGITVISKGGDIKFEGNNSDRIVIVAYQTMIETNEPQIYPDQDFKEMVRAGKNVYVLKTIGLSTEELEESAK
jgi:hypothetical protein